MENRDEMVDKAQAEIEQNLYIIGATAIEDRLQDEVRKLKENLKLYSTSHCSIKKSWDQSLGFNR